MSDECAQCREYFARHSCGKDVWLECDCPRCQGYCECPPEPLGRPQTAAPSRARVRGHAGRVLARRDRLVRRWLDRTGERWAEALRGGAAAKHARWQAHRKACPPCVLPTLDPSTGANNPERRTGSPQRWRPVSTRTTPSSMGVDKSTGEA